MFHGHLDYFQKPPLEGRPNTKSGDHGIPYTHSRWFILLYHVWGPAWIEIRWNSIWSRARSHITSHYTWGSVTTLHDLGGVLGWPLETFFWALTILWSRLSTRVWSGPKISLQPEILKTIGWSSRLHKNYPINLRQSRKHTSNYTEKSWKMSTCN